MDIGFALPVSGAWATPANVADVARAADQRGFRTLWTFQRALYPTAFELPAVYRSVLDPLVVLGFAAAVTTRARLGLAVVDGPFYAPAVLASSWPPSTCCRRDGSTPASASDGPRTSTPPPACPGPAAGVASTSGSTASTAC